MKLETKTLETERLLLRKFETEDAEPMFKNWASNPNVTKHLTWQPYERVEDVREYIKFVINSYSENTCDWMIVQKELGEPIGTIGIVKYNENTKCAVIGYCLSEKYWHKGIMTEAFACIIKFLFEETDINRIESTHDPNNPNSGKVMKKCGLLYEGTHRKAGFSNQGIIDEAVYAILKEDYAKRKS
ncbi:MAG: GNAT family N-acetyltransferase [Ruminococcus sp.]|nr:GNAT family N-acetyltransferase [Ruminococcus sp.]